MVRRLPILSDSVISNIPTPADVMQQGLIELHKLLSAAIQESGKTASAFPASKILLGATVAFFQGKITSPNGRAAFYQLLAEFLHLLSGNLVSAVDALRFGLKSFANEVRLLITVIHRKLIVSTL